MAIVLERDAAGVPILWKCHVCGKPFSLGWGDYCNRCIAEQQRHRELIAAIESQRKP